MASSHHVLILGGSGNISRMLTPLLLKKSWTVTSLIRKQEQIPSIEQLGAGLPGKLNVLVRSLEDVDSQDHAAQILKEVNPDYVAWSAGAGGKGGPESTFKVDRDAAIHFVKAAAATPSISRFLLVSYTGSRRASAPWWPKEDWEEYNEKVNHGVLATYYKAKLAADEAFYETAKKSSSLVGIGLRPGTLTDSPAGKVNIGKNPSVKGNVSRETVAQTAAALLEADGVKTAWIDLISGEEEIEAGVKRVVKDGIDAAEGEAIYSA